MLLPVFEFHGDEGVSHDDFFSSGIESDMLLYAQLATAVLCAFGKTTALPWLPALPSVAWALL